MYERRPHSFTLKDLERIQKSLALESDQVPRWLAFLIAFQTRMFGVVSRIGLLEEVFRQIVTHLFAYSASTMEEIQRQLGWRKD